jgi:hypothetical protein
MLPEGALLVFALDALTPDVVDIMVEEAEFRWHEILGVAPNADQATLRRAMTRLAMLYHPDQPANPASSPPRSAVPGSVQPRHGSGGQRRMRVDPYPRDISGSAGYYPGYPGSGSLAG